MPVQADLSRATFDEFVAFWFDGMATEKAAASTPSSCTGAWYQEGVEIAFDPVRHAQHFIEVFSRPAFLRERYSVPQLEDGFWAMVSWPLVKGGVTDILWAKAVPWTMRDRVLRSMLPLFELLFAEEANEVPDQLESASYMWWDHLAEQADLRRDDPEALLIRRAMFEVLCQILRLDSEPCQRAALHGLNHLRDPSTGDTVREWLASHPGLSPDIARYARLCAEFRAQ